MTGSGTTSADRDLPRALGLGSAIAVLVGSTIGSGIFRVPSTVAADAGSVGGVMLVWVGGAIIALFGALTLAELAAAYPESGGIYIFLREAFGPLVAFLFGWTQLLIIRPSAFGAIALIFADYAGSFLHLGAGGVRVLAGGLIAVLAFANIRSVRWGAAIENSTTAAKVVALLLVATLALLFAGEGGALPGPVGLGGLDFGGLGIATIAVLWAYDGWADLTFMAGEIRSPERNLPRALIVGTVIVVGVYLLMNTAYLRVLPLSDVAASELVAADAATRLFGATGAALIAGLVMLSTFGSLNGAMMTGPRILLRDGEGWPVLPAHRGRAPALPDALGGDRVQRGARHSVRLDPAVRAAGGRLRARHLAVLRAGGRGRVPAPRSSAGVVPALPRGRLSVRPGGLPVRVDRAARQRARTPARRHGPRLRDHSGGHSGFPGMAETAARRRARGTGRGVIRG